MKSLLKKKNESKLKSLLTKQRNKILYKKVLKKKNYDIQTNDEKFSEVLYYLYFDNAW